MVFLIDSEPAGDDVLSDDDNIYFDSLSDQSSSSAGDNVLDLTGEIANDADDIPSDPSSHESSHALLRPRGYQLEMVDEAIQRNIIVAMDTGSGKTLIAVLRIAAELERCTAEQLVWVSCPTVELCEQQFSAISTQLPAFQCRVLTGSDNVDHWSDQRQWDAILKNIRVVVTTPTILLDALTHGFIRLDRIALLVFDEAHNCAKGNPANVIMQNFYHRSLLRDSAATVPCILGLTASPILNAKAGGLDALERNLNAITRTPRSSRQDLMKFVHRPVFEKLIYQSAAQDDWHTFGTPTLKKLLKLYQDLDIREDPYVLSLIDSDNASSRRKLNKALIGKKTYCQDQMKRFCSQSCVILDQLGPYAADYYIHICIRRFLKTEDQFVGGWVELSTDEKIYLAKVLQQLQLNGESPELTDHSPFLSAKAESLIELLVRESAPDFAGLVFVEQRATVAVLSHIISIHPRTKHIYKCGTFVGTSMNGKRAASGIAETVNIQLQRNTLDDLRGGKKNLIITTNVLEEGIDVSACHIVISFDKPANLKSFIQRRGRARKEKSKFVLMLAQHDKITLIEEWSELEAKMHRTYQDHMRELEAIKQREETPEEAARTFLVKSTGALLTMENAVAHLYHFCATLPASPYVDLRPEFVFKTNRADVSDDDSADISEDDSANVSISARVVLPIAVDASVRQAAGLFSWDTEKNAKKDAAFEAYKVLYQAGLVNDNLLPLCRYDEDAQEAMSEVERRPALVEVPEQLNPWISIAEQWKSSGELYSTAIVLHLEDQPPLQLFMLLPCLPPPVLRFILHWNQETRYAITTKPSSKLSMRCSVPLVSESTFLLLSSVYRSRVRRAQHDFAALFTPLLEFQSLEKWLASVDGIRPACDLTPAMQGIAEVGLIRDRTRSGLAHILRRVTTGPIEMQDSSGLRGANDPSVVNLEVNRLPKRADFLHHLRSSHQAQPSHSSVDLLPADTCEVDNLPQSYALFALFIPSIMHRFEIMMVAQELCNTILEFVDFQDVNLVLTAISASSAREGTDYERLELLGDCILKLCTSVQLVAEHPNWHEGYLSAKKDHTVANSRLARAALETGLGKFILTKEFTGQKWRPLYNSDLLQQKPHGVRQISTKILADVVEALIGAAFVEGGMSKALICLQTFLPEMEWQPLATRLSSLYDTIPLSIPLPPHFITLETLIGHHFTRPILLIEVMTHPSFTGSTNAVYSSYQRLEFLGDAVLDNLVVTTVFSLAKREYTHVEMYWLRAALVNADFLAFLAMEWAIDEERGELIQDDGTEIFQEINTTISLPLWKFMRHSSMTIAARQRETVARYNDAGLGNEIKQALLQGTTYPWSLLARLQPDKFFSDIVESVLGAVYLDTKGGEQSNKAIETVAERIGILPYLRRILSQDVQLVHPKGVLGMMVGNRKVEYVLGVEEKRRRVGEDGVGEEENQSKEEEEGNEKRENKSNEEGENGKEIEKGEAEKCFTCTVNVGGRQIVKVGDGISKDEVRTRAAEKAVDVLRREMDVGGSGGGGGGGGGGASFHDES